MQSFVRKKNILYMVKMKKTLPQTATESLNKKIKVKNQNKQNNKSAGMKYYSLR